MTEDQTPMTGNDSTTPSVSPHVAPAVPHKPTTPMAVPHAPTVPPGDDVVHVPVASTDEASVPKAKDETHPPVSPVAPSVQAPPPPGGTTSVAPLTAAKTIEEQIREFESTLEQLASQRVIVEEESTSYFSERKNAEEELAPILLQEKLSIANIGEIEKRAESASTENERRKINKQRWDEEERRRAIESEKWPLYEKLENIEKNIKEKERAFMALVAQDEKIRKDIARLHAEARRRDLQSELEKVSGKKGTTEEELAKLRSEHERLNKVIQEAEMKEKEIEEKEHDLGAKAGIANSLYEERVLAEERHKLEEERRKTEEAEWKAEDAAKTVADSESKSAAELQTITQQEAEILSQLKDIA